MISFQTKMQDNIPMDLNDIVNTDIVEPYSNDASASSFGWNFQYAAGIFLFLKYAQMVKKIKMESEMQDIDLEFIDGTHLYAQAKSCQDYTNISESSKKAKIKDALVSLINTYGKDKNGKYVYISNVAKTIPDDDFSKNDVVSYERLYASSKKYLEDLIASIKTKMEENIDQISKDISISEETKNRKIAKIRQEISFLEEFDLDKFLICTIVPFGDDGTNRFIKISDELLIFLTSQLRIDYQSAIMISHDYISFLKDVFEIHSGTENNSPKKEMKTADLIWPIASLIAFNGTDNIEQAEQLVDYSIDNYTRSETKKIFSDCDLILYHQRFMFANGLIQDYLEFKNKYSGSTRGVDLIFVKKEWAKYKNEFEDENFKEDVVGQHVFELVIKLTLYKIISAYFHFNKVYNWLGANRYDN